MKLAETHSCPRPGCKRDVPDVLFCCPDHWWELSWEARAGISRTARLSLLTPARLAAVAFAYKSWKELDTLQSSR